MAVLLAHGQNTLLDIVLSAFVQLSGYYNSETDLGASVPVLFLGVWILLDSFTYCAHIYIDIIVP